MNPKVIVVLVLFAFIGGHSKKFFQNDKYLAGLKCIYCGKDQNVRMDVSDDPHAGRIGETTFTLYGENVEILEEYKQRFEFNKTYYMDIKVNERWKTIKEIEVNTFATLDDFTPRMFFLRHPKYKRVHLFENTCEKFYDCKVEPSRSRKLIIYKNALCVEGYYIKNDKCVECKRGQWGFDCKQKCQCHNPADCDTLTGECGANNCPIGAKGRKCLTVCPKGKYGADCTNKCCCDNGKQCHAENGTCPNKCAKGCYGEQCNFKCKYGPKCAQPCGCSPEYGNVCNNMTGECIEAACSYRYRGPTCTDTCKEEKFGLECNYTCHCMTAKLCNVTSGICEDNGRCQRGWYGTPHCQTKCLKDIPDCQQQCRCLDWDDCEGDKEITHCPSGCSYRYYGSDCRHGCDRWLFLVEGKCAGQCHCAKQQYCNVSDGVCVREGCTLGYRGSNCQIRTLGITTEVTIGICMALFTIIVLGIFIFVMRRTVWSKYKDQIKNMIPEKWRKQGQAEATEEIDVIKEESEEAKLKEDNAPNEDNEKIKTTDDNTVKGKKSKEKKSKKKKSVKKQKKSRKSRRGKETETDE